MQYRELRNAVREGRSLQQVQYVLESASIETQDLAEILRMSFEVESDVTVIRALIEYNYEVARVSLFRHGEFLLHRACCLNIPVEVIRLLIGIHPEAVRQKDRDGRLPLHLSVRNGQSEEAIVTLLESYPQGAMVRDVLGKLPLDYSYNRRLNILRILVEYCPKCIRVQNVRYGNGLRLPYYYNVYRGSGFGAVRARRCRNHGPGDLALHRVFSDDWFSHSPLSVVEFLVEEYPFSVQVGNQFGHLPLHCAVIRGSTEAVQFLLTCFSEGLSVQDKLGMLPIHYACKTGSLPIVQLLLEIDNRHAAGLDVADKVGRLPVHYAAGAMDYERGTAPEILRIVLERYRQGVRVPDRAGQLPLHAACLWRNRNKRNLAIMSLLLETDLFTVLQTRNDGSMPLQLVSRRNNGQPVENRQLLLEKQDEAVALLRDSFRPAAIHFNLPNEIVSKIWEYVIRKP